MTDERRGKAWVTVFSASNPRSFTAPCTVTLEDGYRVVGVKYDQPFTVQVDEAVSAVYEYEEAAA